MPLKFNNSAGISYAVFIFLIIFTGIIIQNSKFLFDDFNGFFQEPRYANGLFLKANSYVDFKNSDCGEKKKIAIFGNSIFWERPIFRRSVADFLDDGLRNDYCVLPFVSMGTSVVNWSSQLNYLELKYDPDIIIAPVMYIQMVRGDDKIGIEESTEQTLSYIRLKDFLFLKNKFSFYIDDVRMKPFDLIEDFLPIVKYKSDFIYELNQILFENFYPSQCPIDLCSTSVGEIISNYIKYKNFSNKLTKSAPEVILDDDFILADFKNDAACAPIKDHMQFVMNNFTERISEKNVFWYFYNEMITRFDGKLLFVALPINFEEFDREGIVYDPQILDTKLVDFIEETGDVMVLDYLNDPYLVRDFYFDCTHLVSMGNEYLADGIITKIQESEW